MGWISDAIDVRLNGVRAPNAADGDSDSVVLQVRGQKHTSLIITRVIYEDQHVTSFKRFQLDERSIREDWSRVLEATVASHVDLTLVGFSLHTASSQLTDVEQTALIGVMLSDLLAKDVKFGDEWMNPRPNKSIMGQRLARIGRRRHFIAMRPS